MRRAIRIGGLSAFLIGVILCAHAQVTPAIITVSSPSLQANAPIPAAHTADGRNESPAIEWRNVPASTKELALVCEDPDVGNPPPFVHWVVYKIPASARRVPANLPIDGSAMPDEIAGAVQGLSGFRRAIYRGPAPPPGKVHHYHFVVYALDAELPIVANQPPLTRAQLLDAMSGHIIGRGELIATYERK